MSRVILNYILKNFFKYFFIVILIIYGFGIILNLFEEIEFFKKTNENIFLPLMLTTIFVPSMILNLLPFYNIYFKHGLSNKITKQQRLTDFKNKWFF